MTKKNAGTFTCRARVPQTGELEERDIRLDVREEIFNFDIKLLLQLLLQVQEPPNWIIKPSDLRGVELNKVEFKCQALGQPPPKYTWVDKEGIDATEKEGINKFF